MKHTFIASLTFGFIAAILIVGGAKLIVGIFLEDIEQKPLLFELIQFGFYVIGFTLVRWKTRWMG